MNEDQFEQINSILEEYPLSSLYCLELRNQLISNALPGDVPSSVVEMKSDESLLRMVDYDLSSYQTYLSSVEFNWIEAVAKELFITRALLTDHPPNTSDTEVHKLSAMNVEFEKQLQELNASISKDEATVLEMTQELESGYDETIKTTTQSRKLMNEIADLELELNELKTHQTEDGAEPMTIAEVTQVATEYENQLQEMNERLAANQMEVPQLKTLHLSDSKAVEQLRIERHAVEKAEGDRRRTLSSQIRGGTLVKIEAGLTWFKSVRRTYQASMGIISIGFVGQPRSKPDKLRVTFSLRPPLEATLVIEFKDLPHSGTRRIASAYLDRSSQDIEPIVEPYIANNDLVTLIRAVVHFLGHL
ncbi:hypothetical protein DFH28DRAFT_928052 [Melampsora americana]|nr:hypothetical protein DFH28DRAFT_928052 [Melampsora americana]